MDFLETFFERTADRVPDRLAVDQDDGQYTYREIEARANQIAHYLLSSGVRPNDRVCILSAKNVHAYAAVLGTLKAGACWVPLSLAFPLGRLRPLVETIDPKVILLDGAAVATATQLQRESRSCIRFVQMDETAATASDALIGPAEIATYDRTRPEVPERSPDDLAYIIFTSGSAGAPKGVMVQHRNIVQFLNVCPQMFDFEEGLRFAHHSELTFDPSLFDLFHCWARAGTLVPFNKAKYRINPALFVIERRVSVWFSVPSAINTIIASGQVSNPAMSVIRHLLLTGEPLPGALARAWYDAWPDARIYNVYGTTETAIISHWYEVPRDVRGDGNVPVGVPLPGFRIMLMDGEQTVAPGEAGEHVSYGSQISPGYWNDAEATRSSFVASPLDRRLPQTLYRTGDLLRQRVDGLYEYVGRSDSQVKVLGHRVELNEVAMALERHPAVSEAAVFAVHPADDRRELRLVAFVAARDDPAPAALKQFLGDVLPRYMIPNDFSIEALPLPRNANGKIDRPGLKERAEKMVARPS